MATCPEIASPDNDKIELSTYTRDVGTAVVIGCRDFGQHVREPTFVTCLATGQWSIQPDLECDINLDYKERVYLATAIIASLVLFMGCCWITLAILCCRRYRDPYERRSRWFYMFNRGYSGRSTDERKIMREKYNDESEKRLRLWEAFYNSSRKERPFDKYDLYTEGGKVAFKRPLKWHTNSNWSKSSQSNELYQNRKQMDYSLDESNDSMPSSLRVKEDSDAEISERRTKPRREPTVATTSQSGNMPELGMRIENEEPEVDKSRYYRDSVTSRDGTDNKTDNDLNNSLTRRTQDEDNEWMKLMLTYNRHRYSADTSWPSDRVYTRYHSNFYEHRSYDTDNGYGVSTYERSGRYDRGSLRASRKLENSQSTLERPFNVYFMGVNKGAWDRSHKDMTPGESWRYTTQDRIKDKHRYRYDDDFRRSRYDRYDAVDTVDNIPKNDMENLYRLRRKYDRVFAEEHPRFANHYLPRDPNKIHANKVGEHWMSNYPVLRLADHETIYSKYGDPAYQRRRNSDTFLDRSDYRMIEDGGGYRKTRRYSDTILNIEPVRQEFYSTQYASPKPRVYTVDEGRMNTAEEVTMMRGGTYEVITMPSSEYRSEIYASSTTGPKLRTLDAANLELPSYSRTGAYVLKDGGTDYFQGRQDFNTDARKSRKELNHVLYHGVGKTTEIYEDVSERGRNPLI